MCVLSEWMVRSEKILQLRDYLGTLILPQQYVPFCKSEGCHGSVFCGLQFIALLPKNDSLSRFGVIQCTQPFLTLQ